MFMIDEQDKPTEGEFAPAKTAKAKEAEQAVEAARQAQAAREAAVASSQAEVSANARAAYPPDLETFHRGLGLSAGSAALGKHKWTPPAPKRFVLYAGAQSVGADTEEPRARRRVETRATHSTVRELLASPKVI